MAIIYKITNDINNKVYIGQTSQTLMDRWNEHCSNDFDDSGLHRDMKIYGTDHFIIEEIERCSQEEKNEREKYWIKYYNSYTNGYNHTSGGGVKIMDVDLSPVVEEKSDFDKLLEEREIALVKYKKKREELLVYKNEIEEINSKLKKIIMANIENEIDKVWRDAPFNSMSKVSQYIINTNDFLTELDKKEIYARVKNYLKKHFGYSSSKEEGRGESGSYIIEQVNFGANKYPFIKLTYDDGKQGEYREIGKLY